ncbi:MAG: PAS domain-containing protein [SAR202 cluster bacterium]|nr:PAS domain-containing protein [SAR202 cluster bacterium]
MAGDKFKKQLSSLQKEIKGLQRREAYRTGQGSLSEDHPDVLPDLETAIMELSTAEEELRQQQEELEAAIVALQAERQRYRELFEFAPSGYLVTDTHTKIIEANHSAAQLLNVPAANLANTPFINFVLPGDKKAFRDRLARLIEDDFPTPEDNLEWVVRLLPVEGLPRDVFLNAVHIPAGENSYATIRWLLHDVSGRKREEADRLRIVRDLASRARS